jgi:16S rRNA (guanine966-N2)-methyltransferase
MRIISGTLKGRRFDIPNGWKTRPTTDIARESLFNILLNKTELEDKLVLDLYSGSGAVGYEFISRGAQKVTFVEKFQGCITFIKNNLKLFNIESHAEIVKSDVFLFLKNYESAKYDIIFADPPYADNSMMLLPELIFERLILKTQGILIIEHDERHNFEKHTNFVELRKYGQSLFSFFSNKSD